MDIATDNINLFRDLIDKHLFFHPSGFGEGYDSKFTRFAKLYVIIKFLEVDFFKKGIHEGNEILDKLKNYESMLINRLGSGNDDPLFREQINLTEEREIIEFLLSVDTLK